MASAPAASLTGVTIEDNYIAGNTGGAVLYLSALDLNAPNNWWGQATGRYNRYTITLSTTPKTGPPLSFWARMCRLLWNKSSPNEMVYDGW